jgi:hypothetical protein
MTSCVIAALAALVLAAPAVAPAGATAETWPSKRDARRLAVEVAAATCRELAWCQRSTVVPAHRCRRAAHGTVYCAIASSPHCASAVAAWSASAKTIAAASLRSWQCRSTAASALRPVARRSNRRPPRGERHRRRFAPVKTEPTAGGVGAGRSFAGAEST